MNRRRIPVAEPLLCGREAEYVQACLRANWLSPRGPFVERFERSFGRFCEVRYAAATCNGTAALHLALAAAGIGRGDEVIMPALTFIATANAATYLGATPVFADIDPVTWTIDPQSVIRCLTRRTRAIIAVHLYGHPAGLDPLRAIAKHRGLLLIEDAAQAPGALYRGRPVGSIGDLAIFSFDTTKILTTGEGGMVVTQRRAWWERLRLLRDHGMSRSRHFWHPVIGYNYRMTNIQAALGVAQLEQIDKLLQRRQDSATHYARRLAGVPGLTLPTAAPWARHVYWMFGLLVRPAFGLSRNRFIATLARSGIETRPFFYPLHRQPPYRTRQRLPVTESVARHGVTLPSGARLTATQIDRVCLAVRKAA